MLTLNSRARNYLGAILAFGVGTLVFNGVPWFLEGHRESIAGSLVGRVSVAVAFWSLYAGCIFWIGALAYMVVYPRAIWSSSRGLEAETDGYSGWSTDPRWSPDPRTNQSIGKLKWRLAAVLSVWTILTIVAWENRPATWW